MHITRSIRIRKHTDFPNTPRPLKICLISSSSQNSLYPSLNIQPIIKNDPFKTLETNSKTKLKPVLLKNVRRCNTERSSKQNSISISGRVKTGEAIPKELRMLPLLRKEIFSSTKEFKQIAPFSKGRTRFDLTETSRKNRNFELEDKKNSMIPDKILEVSFGKSGNWLVKKPFNDNNE